MSDIERRFGQARQHDGVMIGGLMRCCIETVGDLYPDGPALIATEGQRLQCKYSESELHRMIFKGGFWRWDHPIAEPVKDFPES